MLLKINQINKESEGISFGVVSKDDINLENTENYKDKWMINNPDDNEKYVNGDIVLLKADMRKGDLELYKNGLLRGKRDGLPKNKKLIPAVCLNNQQDEVEFIEGDNAIKKKEKILRIF